MRLLITEAIVKTCKSNKKAFKTYEVVVCSLGFLSVPFVLACITLFFACGSIPKFFLPFLIDSFTFIFLIIALILGLFIHEFSHIVVLANREVKNISTGISISGIWGGFVKADITPETYSKIQLPFYSSGLGSNLLLFLLFLPFLTLSPHLHIMSVANFWLLTINAIPAPLMDGGKVFEAIFRHLKLEKYMEVISIGVLLFWFLIIILRFLIS
ncbi:MAG: hypothetical protein N3D12_02265 [Candidatus Methanomethyliaceae archaeon]|nr:hypothetical protein [Candidatus Methanomethyliaceae archaeon]